MQTKNSNGLIFLSQQTSCLLLSTGFSKAAFRAVFRNDTPRQSTQFSRKRPCIKTSQMQINFIKLPIRCILNLAAVLSREVLKVSSRRRSNL